MQRVVSRLLLLLGLEVCTQCNRGMIVILAPRSIRLDA
jgi:hypothetical protein